MPGSKVFSFDHKQVTEALIKKEGIHEGLWAMLVEFGLGAGNIPGPEKDTQVPAAIVPILKIGIQSVPSPTPLSVDAAEVNPARRQSTPKPAKATK